MIRQILGGTLALATAAAIGLAPAQAQPQDVTVGFVLPLSGGSATIGNQTKLGAQVAAEQINAAGGIASLGGAKLKLIFADSQSKPDIGASETERLIQRENVSLLVGAYNSAVTFPASEVAERYKTPWIVTGAVKDEITERGFKYVFRPNNKATYDAREQLDAMDLLKKETGKGPSSIGLFYEGTDWGRSHAANIKKFAKERGYTISLDESFPPNQVDFTAQLLKIRASKPEALIVVAYTPDHLLFTRQYFENKINIPYGIHSVGGGSEDPSFYKAVPQKAVDYLFVQEDWQIDRLKTDKDPRVLDANTRFKAQAGYDINSYGAQGISNVYLIKDVLERAASTDREKIRDALAATDITSGMPLIVGYQRIKFDEQGQNTFGHGVISENIGGERRTIWPSANRAPDTKPVWPVPDWSAR
ncbi:ABC transporter substrate-binding protein [Xanthobacter autotrophicus]|jgi:branched-chain amino acid transport system substrate-binding protein|uniref:ABC transporter substrate-binding protein n=1 Tax=Xanthobacter autotrophicus TaxID=280 RepID=A0A6C1KC49_XANAU|nr:ABC transporter substrate-binding protein [Xanthobacter autotrophicus]TLX41750.1 ABC transporter substrate-binding protein [Xanthobacter autotrophicus]